MRTMCRSRWFLPLFALALGGVLFGAQAIGAHPGSGLFSLGILAFVGGVAYTAALAVMRLRG